MSTEPRWLSGLWLVVLVPMVTWAFTVVLYEIVKEWWGTGMCLRCKHGKHKGMCPYYRPDVGGGKWVKGQANYNSEFRCRCSFFIGRP